MPCAPHRSLSGRQRRQRLEASRLSLVWMLAINVSSWKRLCRWSAWVKQVARGLPCPRGIFNPVDVYWPPPYQLRRARPQWVAAPTPHACHGHEKPNRRLYQISRFSHVVGSGAHVCRSARLQTDALHLATLLLLNLSLLTLWRAMALYTLCPQRPHGDGKMLVCPLRIVVRCTCREWSSGGCTGCYQALDIFG